MGACLLCYGVGHNATPTKMAGEFLTKQGKSALVVLGMGTRGSSREGSNWSSWCSSGTISRASPEQWKVVGRTYHLITFICTMSCREEVTLGV